METPQCDALESLAHFIHIYSLVLILVQLVLFGALCIRPDPAPPVSEQGRSTTRNRPRPPNLERSRVPSGPRGVDEGGDVEIARMVRYLTSSTPPPSYSTEAPRI